MRISIFLGAALHCYPLRMKPLRVAGAFKIIEGVTTADEVLKVTAGLN